MSTPKLQSIISEHEKSNSFTAQEIVLKAVDCEKWVRFKVEPNRFLPKIFDGEWAHIHLHPQEGPLRLIRVITGNDGITRIIARQGKHIFAYPWFK